MNFFASDTAMSQVDTKWRQPLAFYCIMDVILVNVSNIVFTLLQSHFSDIYLLRLSLENELLQR
jgi:hypothetical protein